MNTAVLKEKLENLDKRFSADAMREKRQLKALVLDLSEESHYEWKIPESYCDAYVSGPALGARLWAEFAGSDVEEESTYESNNPIIITASSLTNSGLEVMNPAGKIFFVSLVRGVLGILLPEDIACASSDLYAFLPCSWDINFRSIAHATVHMPKAAARRNEPVLVFLAISRYSLLM